MIAMKLTMTPATATITTMISETTTSAILTAYDIIFPPVLQVLRHTTMISETMMMIVVKLTMTTATIATMISETTTSAILHASSSWRSQSTRPRPLGI